MGQVAGTRRRGLDSLTVRILLGLGFALAVAASLFVVFADEVRWLRLAVLLGLWAALLAAFAMARYRREARAAELRQEEMTRIYELELHREISARREYEVQLTETTRAELESRHDTELVALREQVERLTSVLSGFLDGDLLVERLTLSAEATRIRSVGDGGSSQAFGSVTRQLVEGTVDPAGPLRSGTLWGPQPPPMRGPLPAAPVGAQPRIVADPSAGVSPDASAGAVTEQIPRIVELTAPTPVIDAVPVTPRVVGDPREEPAEAPEVLDEASGAPDARPAAEDRPDPADEAITDLVEVEHGATDPEPEVEPAVGPEPEVEAEVEPEPEVEAAVEPEPEVEPDVEGAPATDAPAEPQADESARSAAPEFRPATDVPDAPARFDAPATAWTLRHRLDTPSAPPIERAPGSRRAARAAAAATENQPSEAVAEITGGAKDPAGHSSGVSVAELLAAYGGSVPPRRRRRGND